MNTSSTDEASRYRGGCACAAVRYESSAAPLESLHCYCRQCQRATGAGHASQFAVPAKAVSMVGQLRFYDTAADSGHTVSSGFCPVCGSPVLKKSCGYPELLFFHAVTLDDPACFHPRRAVWTASRQPWDVEWR